MNDTSLHIEASDPRYPALLKNVPGAPTTLFVRGTLPDPSRTLVAIVGTRRATTEGLSLARNVARDLSRAGISIVSGLALGIDGAAHAGAIEGGTPTYAVLGNGIDSIYPASHQNLAEQIIKTGGGVLSEYEPGIPSYPNQFLERNRIVSGMSRAVIVIEAPARSGSLSTARHAAEQGRDVFVVPGSPTSRNYQGSHFLIREGARLVTDVKDIMEDLGLELPGAQEPADPECQALLALIREYPNGVSTETLATVSNSPIPKILETLTLLSSEGTIHERNGMFFS